MNNKFYPELIKTEKSSYLQYISKFNTLKKEIILIKKLLIEIFQETPEIPTLIENKIVKERLLTKEAKFYYILNIFNQINTKKERFKNLNLENDIFLILNHITNEIINDNIENLLLNNIIYETENTNNIIKRDSETVIKNLIDFRTWLKKN